ncbi:peptidase domain-containing ABC transporter [Hymenobacter yonginensis]|uniref:Peptidase domain-containing ABC transporter n=1 Tax=Hymenobacter yonginensis TaxID=748197 RepID=A0ABY7PPW3_9BACT|nr:peptidase domain-containing ABC transporter [Hymenobacter yonginensis]WBO85129.1 peptidase domain-containing ABC transporter [Hymenobacter yonginensis]
MFPFYKQQHAADCGSACLKMIAKHYGRPCAGLKAAPAEQAASQQNPFNSLSKTAEEMGFQTLGVKMSFCRLATEATIPCIVQWEQRFVVVYGFRKPRFRNQDHARTTVLVADPALGLLTYSYEEFLAGWLVDRPVGVSQGQVLLLEPTPEFYLDKELREDQQVGMKQAFSYLLKYKKLLWQLLFGIVVGCGFQLILPFLAQAVVDVGVNTHNLSFVYLILIAQVTLLVSQNVVDFVRGWIILHISARINVLVLSGFLSKLLRLPVSFFDVRQLGDIMQRFHDHERIEVFLTNTPQSTLFSALSIVVFGTVLCIYDSTIFFVFLVGTALYVLWAIMFLKRRREIDALRFKAQARNQSSIIQLVQGIKEIKLANSERQKRWEWEKIQASLFKINHEGLAAVQYQKAGAVIINEGKNILITFLAAKAVINGHITLGAMLTVQYILGQLNKPVEQIILFTQTWQDAQISMERLNEIHHLDDEETSNDFSLQQLPAEHSVSLKNVDFAYPGSEARLVLCGISLHIPAGKTTAIVGASGSGKTTLLKLLLKFYQPTHGKIQVGHVNLAQISQEAWRRECGVVTQEGFIFSDTIARNIAVGEEQPDANRLMQAVHIANIQPYIESLPLGFNTQIGTDGSGMSQGQRQRLLIARAVYKDPAFLFLDEATNALDTQNETAILHNLEQFMRHRTVVVVAHRLSTVRSADNIIVMNQGSIVEQGTHDSLIAQQGYYFSLVKNQLELDA